MKIELKIPTMEDLKQIEFKFPVCYEAGECDEIRLPGGKAVETIISFLDC